MRLDPMVGHAKGRRVTIALAMALSAVWCSTSLGQQFTVEDLGSLGGPMAGAYAVNANRVAVGYSATPNASLHGFLWDGSIHELVPLGGDTQSHAFAINSSGLVVGVSYLLGSLVPRAVVWQSGAASPLGDFTARGISDTGTVVGVVSTAINHLGWVDRACVLRNGSLVTLGTLGGSYSYAYSLNSSEQIVGMSYAADEFSRRACLWQNGQVLDLGTLGGTNSQAYAINSGGQVVGVSDTSQGAPHAFLYQVSPAGLVTSRTDLGELGGGYSYAYGISALAEVVGTSNSRAFFWRLGKLVDLTGRIPAGSGWVLNNAVSINDGGRVVGLGTYRGWPHAFLLTPAAPDFDHDGDVDQTDFGHFQACYTGSKHVQTDPACQDAKLDGDDAIDQADFAIFKKCYSGPDIPVQPDCWR